jgi:uncharacterized protein
MREIFFNEFGRLRSGWRASLYIAAFIAAYLVWGTITWVISGLAASLGLPRLVEFVFRGGLLVITLGLGYLFARGLEDLPWRSLGLTLHQGWLKDLIFGSAIGFITIVVAVCVAMAGGGLSLSLNDTNPASIMRSMVGSAGLLILAALAEEAMFRGYPLQTLSRARLASVGVLCTMILFGMAHLANPNATSIIAFGNTSLAGLWLAVAYLRTRSLWLPLGVHWAWNWGLGWFFGLPVSGLKLVSNPLLLGSDTVPMWLTGGNYGIEGGLACTVAMAWSTIFLWRTRWVSATPELMKLTSEENPATSNAVLSIRSVDQPRMNTDYTD